MPQNHQPNSDEYDIPPKEPQAQPNPLAGVKPFVNPHAPKQPTPTQYHPDSHKTLPQQPTNLTSPAQHNTQTGMQDDKKKQKAREKLKKLRKHRHFGTIRFAIISFFVFLLVFNFQLIYSQVLFYITPKPANNTAQVQTTQPIQPAQTTTQPQPAQTVGPENVLIIPKLNVSTPIVFIDSLNETDVLKALQNGVVHYAGTAMPGEVGNAVFFGHSSNDWWEPGNYKFVFVLLEKLVPGDTYEIHYQSRRYIYKVTQTKVVAPNDLSVLAQTTTPTSTLITCTPPGTSWKRFIATAEQIEPVPNAAPLQQASNTANATQRSNTAQPSVLPSAPPSIFSQIQTSIVGFFGRFFGNQNNNSQPETQPQTTPTTNHLPEVS